MIGADIFMPCRVSKFNRVILTMLSLLVVSGQLSAYPLFCNMPGMEMHGMDTNRVTEDAKSAAESNTIKPANESDSQLASGLLDMANCEQICGYCLGYTHPGTKYSNLNSDYLLSRQADLYSRFAPIEPLNSLFRPPISV